MCITDQICSTKLFLNSKRRFFYTLARLECFSYLLMISMYEYVNGKLSVDGFICGFKLRLRLMLWLWVNDNFKVISINN